MAAETGDKREIQFELVDEPVHAGTRLAAENLRDLWLLGAALQRVSHEDVVGVFDALCLLSFGLRAVDAASGLGGVAAAERALVQEEALAAMLHHGVRRREAGQAATYDNRLLGREDASHLSCWMWGAAGGALELY
jgi:hypothetical protein